MSPSDFQKTIHVGVPEGASKVEEERLIARDAENEAEKTFDKMLKDFGF